MANSSPQSSQAYSLRWRHAGVSDDQEISTGDSFENFIKDSNRIVYLEIEKNIPPDVFNVDLRQLQQLKLIQLESSECLNRFLEKVTPESVSFIDGDFSDGIPKLPISPNKLEMVRCRLRVKKNCPTFKPLKEITLISSEFKTDDSLENLLKEAHSVTKLDILDCENTRLPKSLKHLEQLKTLNLSSTHLSSEDAKTLSVFRDLENLEELILTECKLPLVPESVMQLKKLTKLNLTRNKLLGQTIPDKFNELADLEELSLSTCYLSELPSSLSALKKVKSLDLSYNHLSAADALKPIEPLSSLTSLSLSACNLDTLPEMAQLSSLSRLELAYNNFSTAGSSDPSILNGIPNSVSILDISGNNFSGGLPVIVGTLTSLTELQASDCNLGVFPTSILKLSKLEHLDLSKNRLVQLPENFGQVEKLKSLNLRQNPRLISLMGIPKLNLEKLNVEHCNSLISPPPEVCKLGLESIQKFCLEAAEDEKPCKVLPTVAVVGKARSGKTSLVQSLVKKERKMVPFRAEEGKDDFATSVFEIEMMEADEKKVRIIDFGGHEIYHITYCLTLKEDSIPVIVLNMREYKNMVEASNHTEATQRLCFDYVAHPYLVEENLPKPILVLTHRDKFQLEKDFEKLKAKFLETVECLRREMADSLLEQEKVIKHFDNLNEKFFEDKKTFVIGREYDDIAKIRDALFEASETLSKTQIPAKWKSAGEKISNIPKPIVSTKEIEEMIPEGYSTEIFKKILSYSHGGRKLLWYENVPELRGYVFPKYATVTKLLKIFFDHDMDHKWPARNAVFQDSLYGDGVGAKRGKFESSVGTFRESGVMSEELLFYLVKKESDFKSEEETKLALAMLQSFRLVFGPVKKENIDTYIFPYFTKGFLREHTDCANDFPFEIENRMYFQGLPLPEYVYHQMTANLLQLLQKEFLAATEPTVYSNGACLRTFQSTIRLIHNFKSKTVKIQVFSRLKLVKQSWDLMVKISNTTIKRLCKTWKAAAISCKITCPHCRITNSPSPQMIQNPPWVDLKGSTKDHKVQYTRGMKLRKCADEDGVPSALTQPCDALSRRELRELQSYIDARLLASKQMTEQLRPASDVDQIPGDGNVSDDSEPDEEKHFTYTPVKIVPTRLDYIKNKFTNTKEVYSMSTQPGRRTRGLAVLINNAHFEGENVPDRTGSEKDVNFLFQLFQGLGFDVFSRNDLTAENMMSVIKSRTKDACHEFYQAFVLVIMSYCTKTDAVYGVDLKTVAIKDIASSLTNDKFEGMKSKPKLLIVQACGGDKQTFGDLIAYQKPSADAVEAADLEEEAQLLIGHLGEDIILVKSSQAEYPSARDPEYGSPFIRCLVSTFAKHACHKDVVTLLKRVQERTKRLSIKHEARENVYPQLPIISSRLSHDRLFYLFPGYYGEREPS